MATQPRPLHSYLNSKQSFDHNSQITSTYRIMNAGKCTRNFQVNNRNYSCACSQGIFEYDTGGTGLQDNCITCSHSLVDHGDAQSPSKEPALSERESTPASNELLPTEQLLIEGDLDVIRREVTTASLFVRLQQVRVVHVRGTPTSGKSTLSLLLHDHIRTTRPDINLYWIAWDKSRKINWVSWRYRDNVVLIIDEAQASYDNTDLWANLVKPVADYRNGPIIALFGSYGSPTQGPGSYITPMYFAPEQRMSIRPSQVDNTQLSIFFTREEFEDIIAFMSKKSGFCGQPFRLSRECVDYLWLYSNGHPGGIVALLKVLMDNPELRKYRKSATEIPIEDLSDVLNDQSYLFSALKSTGFWRSFPSKTLIQNEAGLAKFLLSVLIAGRSKENPQQNKSLQLCYHKGWLQAELEIIPENDDEVAYVFPSRIHREYVESILLSKSQPFPIHKFPTVQKFCFSAIRGFSSSLLASDLRGLGTGAIQKPKEAQYKDELYRAAYEIVGQQIYLSSEYSPVGLSGRVGFRVSSVNWAIECVREGDRLEQHVARFQKGGPYYKRIQDGSITEYIIIDFRTSMPPKIDFVAPHLFFAVFTHDFRSCHIYDSLGGIQDQFAVLA